VKVLSEKMGAEILQFYTLMCRDGNWT